MVLALLVDLSRLFAGLMLPILLLGYGMVGVDAGLWAGIYAALTFVTFAVGAFMPRRLYRLRLLRICVTVPFALTALIHLPILIQDLREGLCVFPLGLGIRALCLIAPAVFAVEALRGEQNTRDQAAQHGIGAGDQAHV